MDITGYGISTRSENKTQFERHLEEISIQGFTLIKNVAPKDLLLEIRNRLDSVYSIQETSFGKEKLALINELYTARAPFVQDDFFLSVLVNERINQIIEKILGDYYILHLQNGVINMPNVKHHQSGWHRDLPYQDFIISKPLAISAFWCIDPFNENTGATIVLPFSHKVEFLPSDDYVNKFGVTIDADPGDVIVFDSMLYHRSGNNTSQIIRRGINNIYTSPMIKQQIDIQSATSNKYENDSRLRKILGYDSSVANGVQQYRERRLERIK